jgi:hypothetical protein
MNGSRPEMTMKYFLFALLLPCVAACQVDNDIADDGESGSAEARVAAKSGDFCESTCTRLGLCEIEGLVGDAIECISECEELFEEEFLHRGEACAAAGERFMSCISQSTCEDFASTGKTCELSDAEEDACDKSDEPPSSGSGGSPTNPLPGSAPIDGAGPAICSGSLSGGPAPGAESFACDTSWEDCTDGHSYAVSCSESAEGPPLCTCSIDGTPTGTFDLVELSCPSQSDMNVGCGFWIVGPGDIPAVQVSCQGGTGGGGPINGNGCFVEFADCGGSTYHVECTGSGGTERCLCYVDGQPTASFHDPAGFCPSTGTSDELRRVNAGCGWHVSY